MEKENIYVLNQEDNIAINNDFIETTIQDTLKKTQPYWTSESFDCYYRCRSIYE